MINAKTRLNVAWVVLAIITVGYLAIDHFANNDGVPEASTVITLGAILLALLKARIIFSEFMDSRNAPRILRVATNLWILAMGTMLIGTYLVSQRLAR